MPLQSAKTHISDFLSQRRKDAKFSKENPCYFDPFDNAQDKLREKSFLGPSHSFGRAALGRPLSGFARDIPILIITAREKRRRLVRPQRIR
jgi:hypothetical protein